MKTKTAKELRADADALDDIGPCAWDDADAKRAQAQALDAQVRYDARSATKLAIGAALLAGIVTYSVNGQDLVRSGIAAACWLAMGWFGGKVLFHREGSPRPVASGTNGG